MANTVIQLKHSTLTGNVPSSLANGEISINNRDGKFFYSTPASVIITHYPYLGPAGLNKEIQFNDSGTLGSNAGLAFDKTSGSLNVSNAIIVGGRNLDVYANAAFLQANTPSYVANSAASYANAAFAVANTGSGSSSAGPYANAAFAVANSSSSYANAAFAQANSASGAAAASSYANSAFAKANTAQSTASSAASAAAAAQSTADAAYNTNDFASIYTPNNTTTITASARRDTFTIVGESGVAVSSNSGTKTITVAGTPGAQGLTVDYGFVADPLYYAIDYGTL
jgi:hypothetical protein